MYCYFTTVMLSLNKNNHENGGTYNVKEIIFESLPPNPSRLQIWALKI